MATTNEKATYDSRALSIKTFLFIKVVIWRNRQSWEVWLCQDLPPLGFQKPFKIQGLPNHLA